MNLLSNMAISGIYLKFQGFIDIFPILNLYKFPSSPTVDRDPQNADENVRDYSVPGIPVMGPKPWKESELSQKDAGLF